MRTHHVRRPSLGTTLGLVAISISLTGVAFAAIPNSSGTIEGCYDPANAKAPYQLSVVDNPADCAAPAVLLPFNKTGVPGPPGPAGHLSPPVASQLLGHSQQFAPS